MRYDNISEEIQRRIKQHKTHIHTNFGTVSLGTDELTDIYESGDIVSTANQHVIMIDGQAISDATQIIGQCSCNRFLTQRTFRFCHVCQAVRCPACAVADEKLGIWLCETCYRAVRSLRFWAGVKKLFSFPFRGGRG